LNSRTFSIADRGLRGEGLEQRDLPVRKQTGFGTADSDSADWAAFPHQRNGKHVTEAPDG